MLETIVALATPPLKSALAIVRLSGDNCFFVVNKFSKKDLFKYTKNTIIHTEILDNEEIIDDVIMLLYKNPHSFTGEDSIEIICHGSPLIFNKIIEIAIKNGARMANRGEFTSRAFMNNKMDLIEAEAVNDMINATTEESKKLALLSLKGEASKLIAPIKEDFISLESNIEVNIDYPEYKDIEIINSKKIREIVVKNKKYIEMLIENGKKGKTIKDGINVVIIGKPNVGKSSILNLLINEEKAIVTDIKGTTRDIVEGSFTYKGITFNCFDTAGIHESKDYIESLGIEKSKKAIENADILLLVYDSTSIDLEDKKIKELILDKKYIEIYNKKDISTSFDNNKFYFSSLKDNGDILKEKIYSQFNLKEENYLNPSINNAREIGILENILNDLNSLDKNYDLPIDVISLKIKSIINKILSITGEDYDFDILDEVFSRFCVGK